ncbi:unnamed protein product [Gongylonema pulchrum]|uniref:Rho-GAP domain-containing protein n=1 Tax=Gongylonema pulchrum TaxID=637853 RepID=A0A183ELK0_9BILA|nr:unnamed protein product [Gongylonema pulchrum]
MQTFFGGKKLPEDCTTHDVCSLIKRFFRELKTPLFAHLQLQLLEFGDRHEAHRMTVENIARVFAPSLFRDNPPPAPSKRKRGSQDDLIISVRNENELRIAIIIDLIDNAHKIGVPRDYYLASRRPSDATQKVFGGKLPEIAGMRSASAKPISRNTSSVSAAKHKVEAKKDRKMAKQSSLKLTEQYKVGIFHLPC